jgi:putative Mn2+ efflux pump MntP
MASVDVLLIAFGMAVDAFAVCLAVGAQPGPHGARQAFRLAFHFGLFQFMMPILGWLAGTKMQVLIHDFDHWAVFGLLCVVGGRMVYSAWRGGPALDAYPSRGLTLVMLSIVVSMDALAVGSSLALMGVDVEYPALLIGAITGLFSLVWIRLGSTAGRHLGRPVQVAGGFLLIAIGSRVLFQHLML